MRIAYLDCASGISGDMTLGALVDAGVRLESLQTALDSLGLPSCRLEAEEVHRKGFRATKVHVRHEPEHAHRHLHHIAAMIDQSQMSATARARAHAIFRRLAEAEAHVHGSTLEKVHFHEVGAVDSIADIVGVAVAWETLGVDRVVCSPIPTGHGFINIAHGRVSIPAPATAELLKGVPLASSIVEAELTTPTGAAIVASLAESFGPLPPMAIETIGYGAGDKDFAEQGNILRLVLGQAHDDGAVSERLTMLATNIDDATPEVIAYAQERLFTAGALDVFTQPIQMKKSRSAIQVNVLCTPDQQPEMQRILFAETGTLGVRATACVRTAVPRETTTVATPWGDLAGKVATLPNGDAVFSPEYEDCRRAAQQHQVPLQAVMHVAREAFASDARKAD